MIEKTVESTNLSTANGKSKRWIRFRKDRSATPDAAWVFTDGSSSGRFAAVIVHKGGGMIERRTGFEPMTHTRNVGAELNALLLGLEHSPKGERVVVISDYLGIGAWMTGNWKINDPEVARKVARANALVRERGLDVLFVHHAGHQRDDSDFTKYNSEADRLCSGKEIGGSAEETAHGEEPEVLPLRPKSRRRRGGPRVRQ